MKTPKKQSRKTSRPQGGNSAGRITAPQKTNRFDDEDDDMDMPLDDLEGLDDFDRFDDDDDDDY